MKITTNRYELMDDVVVDSVAEKDPLSSPIQKFSPTRGVTYHKVMGEEVSRPDLIAFREYGSVKLWWFILAVNGIVDPLDVTIGTSLEIPSILDYYDFVREQS